MNWTLIFEPSPVPDQPGEDRRSDVHVWRISDAWAALVISYNHWGWDGPLWVLGAQFFNGLCLTPQNCGCPSNYHCWRYSECMEIDLSYGSFPNLLMLRCRDDEVVSNGQWKLHAPDPTFSWHDVTVCPSNLKTQTTWEGNRTINCWINFLEWMISTYIPWQGVVSHRHSSTDFLAVSQPVASPLGPTSSDCTR